MNDDFDFDGPMLIDQIDESNAVHIQGPTNGHVQEQVQQAQEDAQGQRQVQRQAAGQVQGQATGEVQEQAVEKTQRPAAGQVPGHVQEEGLVQANNSEQMENAEFPQGQYRNIRGRYRWNKSTFMKYFFKLHAAPYFYGRGGQPGERRGGRRGGGRGGQNNRIRQ